MRNRARGHVSSFVLLVWLLMGAVPAAQAQAPHSLTPASGGGSELRSIVTITEIEPSQLPATSGGKLAVYGAGFRSDHVAQLVGHGTLDTTVISATLLTAEVPAALAAGVYEVELHDGLTTVRSAQPLTIVATAPTAVPASSPTPEPTQPSALAITQVEPRMVSTAAGGVLSVYGSGFAAGHVVRLSGYGLLATSYVNGSALTAQIPANIPAGVYDIEVSDGSESVRLPKALTFVAPTPTAAPTAPPTPKPAPAPGRPILTIRNYAVEPTRVRAGQEIAVTIEVYNNGSRAGENTLVVFPGGTFTPIGDAGHLLSQLPINHTAVVTQRLRVPASLGSGVYQLPVSLSANDWAGDHYEYPGSVPVEVIGASPLTGQPRVTIERAQSEPSAIAPGAPFTLTLRLANRGSRTARNVFVRCVSELVVPTSGSDAISTPLIAIEDAVTVTMPLLLDSVAAGGRQRLTLSLSYEDPSGGVYTGEETVGIEVNATLATRPQLLIQGYATTPELVTPGDAFTLTLQISNVGGSDAERLLMALGGENGAALEPFSPVHAGNVLFLERLARGAGATVQWRLIVDGAAAVKAYNLPLALAYDDAQGQRHSETQRLSLVVRRRAELQAVFYRQPGALRVGEASLVPIEVVNIGSGALMITGLEATGQALDIKAEGAPFMGTVDAGGSAPLDIHVTPRAAGEAEIVIVVTYRDDFNQTRSLQLTLVVDVEGGVPDVSDEGAPTAIAAPVANRQSQPWWSRVSQILRGLLGLGS